jgi:hypothetical protein
LMKQRKQSAQPSRRPWPRSGKSSSARRKPRH